MSQSYELTAEVNGEASSNPDSRNNAAANRETIATRHAYPHITIGGNARVQLGDQFLQNAVQDQAPSRAFKRTGFDHLDAAAAVVEFIDFATRLTAPPAGSNRIAQTITFTKSDLAIATRTLDEHCTLLSRIDQEGVSCTDGPTYVSLGAVSQVTRIAEELDFVIQELARTIGQKDYESLQQAVVSIWKHGDRGAAHDILLESCMKATFEYLLSRRPEPGKPPRNRTRIRTFVERFLSFGADGLFETHFQAFQDLCKILSPGWLSYRTPGALQAAAEEWLQSHSELIRNYTSWVLSETSVEHDLRFRWQLLETLSFDEINTRYEGISPAQRQTYEWLFDASSQAVGDSFAKWLDNSRPKQRVYWISGKPGSGKSTLMRFLSDESRTTSLSTRWSQGRQILMTRCFFWDPGSMQQKSQTGLLQTLLHQLLKQHTAIPGFELFPNRWQALELGGDANFPWSVRELQNAIFICLQIATKQKNVYMFVDGLDEYKGTDDERVEVCNLLRELASNPRVKICASSRPWNVYRDAFADCPSLRLEDLNEKDIRTFVEQAMGKDRLTKGKGRLTTTEAPKQMVELIDTIVHRAQGVFLWARLVVRSLLSGLRDGDDAQEMTDRLDDIPADLEQYFQQMLMKLKPEYREQASQIFDIALHGASPLMLYYFMHKAHRDVDFDTKTLTLEDIKVREDLWDRRINARCMDLLESPKPLGRTLRIVDFMHRTARDFVAARETQQLLASWRKERSDSGVLRLKSYVAMLQSCDVKRPWMNLQQQALYLHRIVRLAAKLTKHSGVVDTTLKAAHAHLDELLKVLATSAFMISSKQYAEDEFLTPEIPDFLSLALIERLDSYAAGILSQWSKVDLQERSGRPLLDCALSKPEVNDNSSLPMKSIAHLLQLGANTNEPWRGASVFGHFLQRLSNGDLCASQDECYQVTEMLISAGSTTVITQNQKMYDGVQDRTVRKHDPEDIFAKAFTPHQQKSLTELLRWAKASQRHQPTTQVPPRKKVPELQKVPGHQKLPEQQRLPEQQKVPEPQKRLKQPLPPAPTNTAEEDEYKPDPVPKKIVTENVVTQGPTRRAHSPDNKPQPRRSWLSGLCCSR